MQRGPPLYSRPAYSSAGCATVCVCACVCVCVYIYRARVLLCRCRLEWSKFYSPDDYDVDFDPPTPLVRDPANPGVNVAASLAYWGQLRSAFTHWLRTLNITLLTSCT